MAFGGGTVCGGAELCVLGRHGLWGSGAVCFGAVLSSCGRVRDEGRGSVGEGVDGEKVIGWEWRVVIGWG